MVVSRRKMKYISKLFWLFLICFVERNLGDNVSEHSYYVEHVEDSVLANSGSNSSDINIGNHDTVGFDKETTSAFEVEGCSRFTNCTSCVDAGCVFIQCSIKNVTDKKFDPLCEKDNEIIQLSKEKCSGELNAISQSALCSHHANVNDENTDISSDIPDVKSFVDQTSSSEIPTTNVNDTELPTTASNVLSTIIAQSTVFTEKVTTFSPSISTKNKTSSVVSVLTPSTTPLSTRRFDAPSFIGGIVLSLGFLAILYVGFKFYKAHTERNYHTL